MPYQFNDASKKAYITIVRNKLKAQMGDQADRIDLISDQRILELHEEYREHLIEGFSAKVNEMKRLNPDSVTELL